MMWEYILWFVWNVIIDIRTPRLAIHDVQKSSGAFSALDALSFEHLLAWVDHLKQAYESTIAK